MAKNSTEHGANSLRAWLSIKLIKLHRRVRQVILSPLTKYFPDTNKGRPVIYYEVEHCDASLAPVYFRNGALRLMSDDLCLLARQSWMLPLVMRPPSKLFANVSWAGIFEQTYMTILSFVITIFFLFTPIVVSVAAPLLFVLHAFNRSIQGDVTITAEVDNAEKYNKEAWIFINGVATSRSGLEMIIQYLSEKFGRPILGIHNRTFGIWFDLIECMLQRDLLLPTQDVNIGYTILCEKIRDIHIERVVLMAHSQGGIIASAWADQLLVDFPPDHDKPDARLNKLEVYTFASAANHFAAKPFRRVEHFANGLDYVARIGVLAFAPAPLGLKDNDDGAISDRKVLLDGRYEGVIFKRQRAMGHLLLSHYFGEGESILDDPLVVKNSRLMRYVGGKNAL